MPFPRSRPGRSFSGRTTDMTSLSFQRRRPEFRSRCNCSENARSSHRRSPVAGGGKLRGGDPRLPRSATRSSGRRQRPRSGTAQRRDAGDADRWCWHFGRAFSDERPPRDSAIQLLGQPRSPRRIVRIVRRGHDKHRAGSVVNALVAHGAEQQAGESPPSTGAHDQRVSVRRLLEQNRKRAALHV